MNAKNDVKKHRGSQAIARDIMASVEALDYGSVLIKVHAGKIVQVEITERKRFNDPWEVQKGGGI